MNGPELKPCVQEHLNALMERFPALTVVKQDIVDAFVLIKDCYEQGHKILIAGNGGSAADSEHIAGELMKRFETPRPVSEALAQKLKAVDPEIGDFLIQKLECPLTAVPLVAHEAMTTAFINDVGCEGVFAQQLFGFGRPGDVLLAISTSGNSQNVIYASVLARALDIRIVGLTGSKGGKLAQMADVCVRVPSDRTYQIQEYHLPVYHCLCLMLESHFFEVEQ